MKDAYDLVIIRITGTLYQSGLLQISIMSQNAGWNRTTVELKARL